MRRLVLLLALLAGLVLAGGAAASDSYDGVSFASFTLAPGNLTCVGMQDEVAGPTGVCDPINVIFPGQSLDTVVARLHAAGWSDAGGTTQWLWFGGAPPLVPEQAQLAVGDGPDPTQRYHVRLWRAGPLLVVGNVHHEHGSPHAIDEAWDAAEAFLASTVCRRACTSVRLAGQDALQHGGGVWRGWANDAYATVVKPVPAPRSRAHARAARGPASRSGARARG